MTKILLPSKPEKRCACKSVSLSILRFISRKQAPKVTPRRSFDSSWSGASNRAKSDLSEYEKTILHGSGLLSVPLQNMLFCRPRHSKMPYYSARGNSDSDRALLALQSCRFHTVSVCKATKISDKWWKGAIFTYFSCGNWQRKLVDPVDMCAKVTGHCREFKIQRFGLKTTSEAFVLAEITFKYWTYWKTAFSTFCTKTYHLVKQRFLS